MKHLLTMMICVCCLTQIMAQKSDLIFFSEGGENFILFVNGVRQNATPAANVKAEGVKVDFAQIRIQFESSGIPEVQQAIPIEPGMEMTSIIKKNNKGKYVLRPVSSVPLDESNTSTGTTAMAQSPAPTESVTTNTVTTTTTASDNVPASGSSVGINVSESQTGVNMNVNINVNDVQSQMSTTETTVTTTTSSTTSSSSSAQPAPATSSNACATAMSSSDFETAKKAISSKSFSDDQMTVSKQILKSNCLSVTQVRGIMELFSYEENKLEFAKLAYPKTVDKGNYYQVNDSFSFSASITELNKFLEAQE